MSHMVGIRWVTDHHTTPDFPSIPGASHTERGRGGRERDVDCRNMEEPQQVVEEYNRGGAQSREGGCDPPLPLSRSVVVVETTTTNSELVLVEVVEVESKIPSPSVRF